jgi:uncharacterized repeat protein (TIGR02543 family)
MKKRPKIASCVASLTMASFLLAAVFLVFIGGCNMPSLNDYLKSRNEEAPQFVPVTDISGVPETAVVGLPLTLNGTVEPANATHKTILWSVVSAGTTGAQINGNVLSVSNEGLVVVRAVIDQGLSEAPAEAFSRDFPIMVKYTLTYDANGGVGSPPASQEGVEGDTITIAGRGGLSNPGYQFVGWSASADGSGQVYLEGYELKLGGSVFFPSVLYAVWKNASQYTVTCNAEGGEQSKSSHRVTWACYYSLSPATKAGWIFAGWYSSPGGTGEPLTDEYGLSLSLWDKMTDTTVYAKWTANTYTVVYDRNRPGNASGEVTGSTGSSSHTYGQWSVLALNGYALSGWTFNNWSDKADYSGTDHVDYVDGQSVTNLTTENNGTVTLYAKWTANKYTVTYDYQGATGGTDVMIKMVDYDSFYDLAVPTKAWYVFAGWYTGANGQGTALTGSNGRSLAPWTILSNRTVYACWSDAPEYTVFYDAQGGVVTPAAGSVLENSPYSLAVPTRAGYTFDGWYTEPGGTGTQLTNGNGVGIASWTIKQHVTVYAKWTARQYLVVYDAEGGSVSPLTTTVTYGSSYSLAVPTRAGYAFAGWYEEDNGTGRQLTYASGVSVTVWNKAESAAMVYAKWTANQYLVYYLGNTPTSTSGTVTGSTEFSIHSCGERKALTTNGFVLAGYTFDGWAESSGGLVVYQNGQEVLDLTFSNNVAVILYAHWTPKQYTVFYDAQLGSVEPATGGVMFDSSYNLAVPVRESFGFVGWYTQGNRQGTQLTGATGASLAPWTIDEDNKTIYAGWQANPLSVSYVVETSEIAPPSSTSVFYGVAFTLTVPVRTGWTFGGWWTQSGGTGTQLTGADGVGLAPWNETASNTTVYARWAAKQYTVTYDAQGGSVNPETRAVTYASPYSLIEMPVRTGYTFSGWYTAPGGTGTKLADGNGVSSSASWTIPANTTVYASWTANTYTIYLNPLLDSVELTTLTVTYDSPMPTVIPPTQTGYIFEGYYANSGVSKYYQSDGTSAKNWAIASDYVILLANWVPITYTVVYQGSGSTGGSMSNSVFTYDEQASLSPNGFTRAGYTFAGWAGSLGGEKIRDDGDSVVNLTTVSGYTIYLYALWTPNQYTVEYNGNGSTVGSMSNSVFTYDVPASLSANGFTRTGYTFAGWAGSPGGEAIWGDGAYVSNLTTEPGGIVTIYARWAGVSSTIILDPQPGSGGTANVTAAYSSALPDITPPTRTGYTFTGYYYTGGSVEIQYYTGAGKGARPWDILSGPTTLYAGWMPNQYTVTFDATGGTPTPDSRQVTYDSTYGALPVVSRDSYSFDGWYTESGERITAETVVTITHNQTLYAWWYQHSAISVTFNGMPEEQNIGWYDNPAETISWSANQVLSVSVNIANGQWASGATAFAWYVDGVLNPGATSPAFSINAQSFALGQHTIAVKVTKGAGGVAESYSKTLWFTVVE